jgi:hypothetical protein
MVTTAALALAEAPSGEMMSPTSAFLVRTTASKGTRMSVYSRLAWASARAASRAASSVSAWARAAAALSLRAVAVACADRAP